MSNRIVIIGGLSAGPSAAAKARREDENAEILLFEKTNHISYATCGIPYALSGKIKDRDKLLVVKPQLLESRFKVEMHLNEPVEAIDTENKTVQTNQGSYHYDKLIYAAGAFAFTPDIKGLKENPNWAHAKSLEDYDRIIKSEAFQKAKRVSIIGAGLIGLETAENLVEKGLEVNVIERGQTVLGPWGQSFGYMAGEILKDHGVNLRTGSEVVELAEDGSLILDSGESLDSDFLIVSIGVIPNTGLLKDRGVETIGNGAIVVNDHMETSIKDVYAAGDCAAIPDQILNQSGWFPMGTHSNKAGRVAGVNAVGKNEVFKGGYGTAIMQLFDHTISKTGKNARDLERAGIPFERTLIIAGVTPGFYPDPSDLILEIFYHAESHRILGAELLGKKGVDKRTDVLATAIYAKLSIDDLPQLDLAYAPPYSPAKDPVVVAGFVAGNSMSKSYKEVGVEAAESLIDSKQDLQVLDLRNPGELKAGKIDASINIPLDQLRERLDELDSNKPTLVYCAKGLRGYLGTLILAQHGFGKLYNLAGGFTMWNKLH
ncbi:MAG: FAD-dependent oxidoreductase [Flavobacteriaceae bacterium]